MNCSNLYALSYERSLLPPCERGCRCGDARRGAEEERDPRVWADADAAWRGALRSQSPALRAAGWWRAEACPRGYPMTNHYELLFLTCILNLLMTSHISDSLYRSFLTYVQNQPRPLRGRPTLQRCKWGAFMPGKHHMPQLCLKILWTRRTRGQV